METNGVTLNLVISGGTLVVLIGVAFRQGIFQGDVRARLDRIEKAIFDGQFVRKDETAVRVEDADREHAEFRRRIESLEKGGSQ